MGDFIHPFNTIDRHNDNVDGRIKDEEIINGQWTKDGSSLSHSNINLMVIRKNQHKTTTTIMKHGANVKSNNDNDDKRNKEMIIEISITSQQNIRNGCQSPPINSCIELHCRKPFICIDEWMVAKCRSVNVNFFYLFFSFWFYSFSIFFSFHSLSIFFADLAKKKKRKNPKYRFTKVYLC